MTWRSAMTSTPPDPPQANIRSADGRRRRNKIKPFANLVEAEQGTTQSNLVKQCCATIKVRPRTARWLTMAAALAAIRFPDEV